VPEEFASHILNFIARNKIGPNGVEVSTALALHFSNIYSFTHFSMNLMPVTFLLRFLD
jgi:hypothetical protein